MRQLLAAGDVLGNHYDAGSTGQTLTETVLTPANVGSTQGGSSISTNFGRLFSTTLDGQVYAQPLAVSNVNITRGSSQGIHNVLYVATMHNSLYVIDQSSGVILWQDNFNNILDPTNLTATAGVRTIPAGGSNTTPTQPYNALVNGNDVGPEIGILATPTIDPATGILYCVVATQEYRNGSTPVATFTSGTTDIHFVQRLWAVNTSNGTVAISPINIAAEPASSGKLIGDTILNPKSGSSPSFSAYSQTLATGALTRSGTTATATISNTGGMRVGDDISISGASPAGYNGSFTVTAVPSSTTFQFTVSSSLTTPATGTIILHGAADYRYVDGPYIKGTGNNSDTFNADGTVAVTDNADSWQVNLADGSSIFAGTTPSRSGYIAFNALLQMNRVATTLINGQIYLGFASHGDDGPYYGWLLGYSASTLANTAAFVTVPTFDGVKGSAGFTSVGGLWGSGSVITTDGTYLYFTVGNGSFNNAASNFSSTYSSLDAGNVVLHPKDGDYGDSIVKVAFDSNATQTNVNLKNAAAGTPTPDGTYNPTGGYDLNGYGLKVVDFFTPSNVRVLNVHDEDLGSGGVLLIPSTGPGSATAPNGDPMLVTAGKEGRLYLIDANNMGGFNTQYVIDGHDVDSTTNSTVNPAPYDRVLGEFYYRQWNGNPGIYANDQTNLGYEIPSYFNGTIYFGLSGAPELGITVSNLLFPAGPTSSRTANYSSPSFNNGSNSPSRGTTAGISANVLNNPIVWNNLVAQNMTDATLQTALTSGQTGITTLTISALATALSSGTTIKLQAPNSSSSQTVTLSAAASVNAASLSVTSFTASATFPVGTVITVNSQAQDFLVAYNTSGTVLFNSDWTISGQPNPLSNNLTNGVPGATGVKFSIPTVANGMVYVGTGGGSSSSNSHALGTITGYGLLSNIVTLHQPVNANSTATSPTTIHVAWTRNSADTESGTKIERSLDGNTWTTIQIVHSGTTSVDDSTVSGGTKYFYRLTEIYASQSSAASTTFTVTTPPSLSSALSRKMQGSFTGDLPLPLSGTPAIEPRAGGPTQLVFTFGQALDTSGLLTVNPSSGSGSASYLDSTHVSIAMSGATDGQTLSVTLTGPHVLNGQSGSYTLNIGVLLGDIDGSSAVNVADVITAKLNSGAAVDGSNYLIDLNADGAINVADVTTAKLNSGHILVGGGPQSAFVAEAVQSAPSESAAANTVAAPVLVVTNDQTASRLEESESGVTGDANITKTFVAETAPSEELAQQEPPRIAEPVVINAVERAPTSINAVEPEVPSSSAAPQATATVVWIDSALSSDELLPVVASRPSATQDTSIQETQTAVRAFVFAKDAYLLDITNPNPSTKAKVAPADAFDGDATLNDILSLTA